MAQVHHTSLTPGKLELLTRWLPRQPWYRGTAPALQRVGGFRLDDPDGEVGIEGLFVADGAGAGEVYQVPLGYRGEPLAGADDALVGESEHGVLGHRWFYDGVRDPVVVAQLLALAAGEVEAQAQSVSDTVDPSVRPSVRLTGRPAAAAPPVVADAEPGLTSVALEPAGLELVVVRVLVGDGAGQPAGEVVGAVAADVPRPGAASVRQDVVLVRRR
jgi:hypothetical protein